MLHPPFDSSLLFVVAKLYGQPVGDTAESGRLHLPVVDGVREQADAVVEHPLHPKSSRAEVIHAHMVDIVGVEVHHLPGTRTQRVIQPSLEILARIFVSPHLQVFHIWEACGDTCEPVVVQMELPQPGEVIQTAVLNVPDVVEAKSQPGRSETIEGTRNLFHREKKTQTSLADAFTKNECCRCLRHVVADVLLWCEGDLMRFL